MDQNPSNPPKPPANTATPPPNLPRTVVPPAATQPPQGQVPPPPKPSNSGITLRIPEPPSNSPQQTAPAQPAPAPSAPPAPTPRLSPQPTPVPKPRVPAPLAPTEYKTAIRSMADDIAKIKIGQQPTGTEVQKTIVPAAPTQEAPAQAQPSRLTQQTPVRASLGETERSSTIRTPTLVTPSTPSSLPPQPLPNTTVVSQSGGSRSWLYLLIITLAILGMIVYLIMNRESDVPEETPTPLATQTATPTPTPSISNQFPGVNESITLSETDPAADLQNKINGLALNPGELKKVIMSSALKGSGDLSITDLMSELKVTYPTALETALGEDILTLVYGQREVFSANGQVQLDAPVQKRLVFLTEIKDLNAINQILSSWEPTMPDSLGPIFLLNKAKATGSGFLDNPYNGTSIRYRNFAYPDRAIDYAIIRASNGRSYLMLAGSREAAFSVVDRLR
jgi:hypothetical protein